VQETTGETDKEGREWPKKENAEKGQFCRQEKTKTATKKKTGSRRLLGGKPFRETIRGKKGRQETDLEGGPDRDGKLKVPTGDNRKEENPRQTSRRKLGAFLK